MPGGFTHMAPRGYSRRWDLHSVGCAAERIGSRIRFIVFQRDDWTCRGCGGHGSDLHHLSDGDYRDDRPSGLITLCRSCHQAEHRLFGAVQYQPIPRPIPKAQLRLPFAA